MTTTPVQIIAEDMFDILQTFNLAIQSAVNEHKYTNILQARKQLDNWFAERNVILISRHEEPNQ